MRDPPEGLDSWPEFDREVFGGNYTNHYGNAMKVTIKLVETTCGDSALTARRDSAAEIRCPLVARSTASHPLSEGPTVVIEGSVEGHAIASQWRGLRRADGGKSFYTSLGHVDDFHGDVLPQLLANAIAWSLDE